MAAQDRFYYTVTPCNICNAITEKLDSLSSKLQSEDTCTSNPGIHVMLLQKNLIIGALIQPFEDTRTSNHGIHIMLLKKNWIIGALIQQSEDTCTSNPGIHVMLLQKNLII